MSITVCTRIKKELQQQRLDFDKKKREIRIGYESAYSRFDGLSSCRQTPEAHIGQKIINWQDDSRFNTDAVILENNSSGG